MKKTRMPQRLLSLVLVLMMLISVLPVSAMAAELTPSDPETGLTATDVTNELTDSDRLAIFEENMDSSKVSRSEIPADDEMVKVIVQLDADSLLDVRNRTNASIRTPPSRPSLCPPASRRSAPPPSRAAPS